MRRGVIVPFPMRWLCSFPFLVVISLSRGAHADDPAAAEVLFREGRELKAAGNIDAACLKLQASLALDPSPGTLLNLADCHSAQGRTATAWAEFVTAGRFAHERGKDKQEAEANLRSKKLEPDLSYLTLQVKGAAPGLTLRRDGERVVPGTFGSRLPVDPGKHTLEAAAPGYQPWKLEVEVGASRADLVVEVPPLQQLPDGESMPPAKSTAPEQKAESAPAGHEQGGSALPWVIGGIGGALLVGGGVAGVLALSSNSAAEDRCPTPERCTDPKARSLASRRDTEALVADIGVGVGLAGIGVAAYLLLSEHSDRSPRGFVPAISADRAGLNYVERF